jgi:hypothetical protein
MLFQVNRHYFAIIYFQFVTQLRLGEYGANLLLTAFVYLTVIVIR